MATVTVKISDKAIERYRKNPTITRLKDPRYPLYLHFNKARSGGSWTWISYSGNSQMSRKIGSYPATKSLVLFDELSAITVQFSKDKEQFAGPLSEFEYCGQLLSWYQNRIKGSSGHSKSRKACTKSAIRCHLMPALESIRIDRLSSAVVDRELIWPLQQQYTLSHVRSIFYVLKAATKQAKKIRLIDADPMSVIKFSDFIDIEFERKDGRIKSSDVTSLINDLTDRTQIEQILVWKMLAFGTRIGETIKAKWSDISFEFKTWSIPKENTKTKQSHQLPLSEMMLSKLKAYRQWQLGQGISSGFLFPGNRGQGLSSTKASEMIQSISDRQWTAHDLRKVCRSTLTDLGVDDLIGEFIINHAISKQAKTYIQTHAKGQIKKSLFSYHEWLMSPTIFD